MKKLLMFTLLLLLVSAFASCNSYDVEGKPEVASNPAKKVFAYYPWGTSGEVDQTDNETTNDNEVVDEEVADDAVNDEEITDNELPDESADESADEVAVDEDVMVITPDEDVPVVFKAEAEVDDTDATDQNEAPVDETETPSGDDLTEVFEIYNRGVTGELKIAQINMLDPEGKKIELLDNNEYKNLFKMQIQKTDNGIAGENTTWGPKILTFDNLDKNAEQIASLCPLNLNPAIEGDKECKKSFSEEKYNPVFKILLTYSKNAATNLISMDTTGLTLAGDFAIEICTNDTGKDKSETCPEGTSSYKIQITRQPNKPPKPIIHVTFDFTTGGPMSYRNIKDEVEMNLKETCVSDPENPSQCLADWADRYYIKYKWEMKQSPTPLYDESMLVLPDSSGTAGQWLPDLGGDNPKRAQFTGLMVTPRRYTDANPEFNESKCTSECGKEPTNIEDKFYFMDLSNFLLCRQKYCEKTKTRFYKVNIQAETVDRETDLVSDTEEITVVPKIIPQARVVAQLTWLEGYKTNTEAGSDKEGTKIDLDIHLIKRSSLEAAGYGYNPTDGVMCTSQQYAGANYDPLADLNGDGKPDYEEYFRHDDCSFADQGLEAVNNQPVEGTIGWEATFDLDNRWGGNNYENPETIGLGPIEDKDGDGKPDQQIIDDQYLVVVSYSYCTAKNFEDSNWDTCCDPSDSNCIGDGYAYEVNARVDILVDGFEAARPERTQSGTVIRPADNYDKTSKLFTIRPDEWKVIAAIKWDSSLPGPDSNPSYEGDAIVTDIAMTDEGIEIDTSSYKTCKFDVTLCELVPVWDVEAYYEFVAQPTNPADTESAPIGECY